MNRTGIVRSTLCLGALLLAVGCGPKGPEPLVARGTVELPEVDLSAPVPARVVTIRVDEGSVVQAGDTLVTMSQTDLPASIAAQRARVASAESQLRDLEAGARPEELGQAEAELAAARAEAERTAKDAERIRNLAANEVVSRQQLDQANTAARVAAQRQKSAEQALELLKAGSRTDRIRMARSDVANARASLGMIEARASDLVLLAPVSGRIQSRQAEPGEQLPAGVPALTLGETARPYVRVYVPASRLGDVRLKDTVVVTPEGQKTPGGRGIVVAINSKAEFTPRVALTEQERADLMFGVKVDLLAPFENLHPGLWVRADFSTRRGSGDASAR